MYRFEINIYRRKDMATLMQKDVLLEGVSQALGYIYSVDFDSEEVDVLLEMRKTIYRSEPEELDFDVMITYIKNVIEKYKG